MLSEFLSKRQVEFRDTDAAGIAHFSSLIVFMEQAEHELLRSLGLFVAPHSVSQASSAAPGFDLKWPRISVEAQFHSPARFEDKLEIYSAIKAIGRSSVTYSHRIQLFDRAVASGTMRCVCCQAQGGELVSHEIPEPIRQLLNRYVIT